MAVWAAFGRRGAGGRWYLKSVSVISAAKARALALPARRAAPAAPGAELAPGAEPGPDGDLPRDVGDLVVREYAVLQAIPWWLEQEGGLQAADLRPQTAAP
jgi:hypothetical protein